LSYGSVTRASHSSRAAIEAPFIQHWFPPQRQEMLLGTSKDTAVPGICHPHKSDVNTFTKKQDPEDSERQGDHPTLVPFDYRKLAAIESLLQSTTTALFAARHHTWQLVSQEHEGLNGARNPHQSWNWTVTISEASKQSAQWWLTELEGWNGHSMAKEQPDLTLETDASDFAGATQYTIPS
jgi:hypothetical protein